jgi:protein AFG1
MNAIYAAPKPVSAERGPWNKSIREHFQGLIKSGTMPIRWRRTNTGFTGGGDPPIAFMVAKRLLLRHWLLVFDEIQLLDVSSANLLADVLSWYWRMGGVIVGTSNKVPDELYRNGVQKERLEPFVEALKARCPVTILDAEKDWREVSSTSHSVDGTWFTPDQRTQFDKALQKASHFEEGEYQSLPICHVVNIEFSK